MHLQAYRNAVVSVGSRVRIHDIETGEREVYTLTRPNDADIRHNRISTFSPIGRAIYGKRPGSIVKVEAPGGVFRVEVEAVEAQPEDQPKEEVASYA